MNGIGANFGSEQIVLRAGAARVLEHQRAHHQVVVPIGAWVYAVGTDPTDARGEVDDELRVGVGIEALDRFFGGEVVVNAARDCHIRTELVEAVDDVRAEKAGATSYDQALAIEVFGRGFGAAHAIYSRARS